MHPPADIPAGSLEQLQRCPACAGADATELYRGLTDVVFGNVSGNWCLHACQSCGTAYLSPRPTTESIALAYAAGYYTHVSGDEGPPRSRGLIGLLRNGLRNAYLNNVLGANARPAIPAGYFLVARLFRSRARRLDYSVRQQDCRRGTRLLDVGCGNGAYLARMNAAGWTTCGVEPDPKAAEMCRQRGLDVRPSLADFPVAFVDSVTLDHVVEHVHDPLDLLRGCYRALVPGGTIWIATPNVNSRGHRRFGADWRGLEVPRHLTVLSEAGLRLLLQRSGFTAIRFLPSYLAQWMYQASNELRASRRLPMFSARDVTAWAREDEARHPGESEELVALAVKPRHEDGQVRCALRSARTRRAG